MRSFKCSRTSARTPVPSSTQRSRKGKSPKLRRRSRRTTRDLRAFHRSCRAPLTILQSRMIADSMWRPSTRAQERAARSDAKIAMLESELGGVNKTMKSLSVQGDENGKREEDLEEEIKDVKERFRDAEVKAEMAERTVQKLQT